MIARTTRQRYGFHQLRCIVTAALVLVATGSLAFAGHETGTDTGAEVSDTANSITQEPQNTRSARQKEARERRAVTLHGPKPAMPVVVELFTSQGCSGCLAGDALLAEMANRRDVLALSFHVEYWDYLGWPDGFAQPDFTERQMAYQANFDERGLYTPQFIINGTDVLINPKPAELAQLISGNRAAPPALDIAVRNEGAQQILTLTPIRPITTRVEVTMIHYLPYRSVRIEAGENAGKEIEYRNIVLRLGRLADWDGKQPIRIAITPPARNAQAQADMVDQGLPDDTRHAIIVQQAGPGPVLAAFKLD